MYNKRDVFIIKAIIVFVVIMFFLFIRANAQKGSYLVRDIKVIGNVGIGTTSPQKRIEIQGSIPSIYISDTASNGFAEMIKYRDSVNHFTIMIDSNSMFNLAQCNVSYTPDYEEVVSGTGNFLLHISKALGTIIQKLKIGATAPTVSDISRTVIDDSTKLVTSKAVYDYLQARISGDSIFINSDTLIISNDSNYISSHIDTLYLNNNPIYNIYVSGDTLFYNNDTTIFNTSSGYWTKSGDTLYNTALTEYVGIGTKYPHEQLHVSGSSPSLLIDDTTNSGYAYLQKYKSTLNMFNVLIDSNSTFSIYQSSTYKKPTWAQSVSGNNALFHVSEIMGTRIRKLTIGGTNEVNEIITSVTNDNSKLVTSKAVYDYLQWSRVAGTPNKLYNKTVSDYVGIGTTSPQYELDIHRNTHIDGSIWVEGGNGDADETGYINSNDATVIQDMIDNPDDYTRKQKMNADITGNGLLTALDRVLCSAVFVGAFSIDSANHIGKVLESKQGSIYWTDPNDLNAVYQSFEIPVRLSTVAQTFELPDLSEESSPVKYLVLDADDSLRYGTVSSSQWLDSGDNIYFDSNVGIGTTTIPDRLTVNGQINVSEGLQVPGGFINITALRTFYAGEATGTLGSGNTYISYQTGANKTGNYNNVSGYQAFNGTQTGGSENNISGALAAQKLTGSYNDISGAYACYEATWVSYSVVSGYHALDTAIIANGTVIGSEAGQNIRYLIQTTITGNNAGQNADSLVGCTYSGSYAGEKSGNAMGSTFTGSSTGQYQEGDYNTSTGSGSMRGTITGSSGQYNTNTGALGLAGLTSGNYNAGTGYQNGYKTSSGSYNTYLGPLAGHENQTGNYNVFVGYSGGYYETGSYKLYVDISNTSNPLIWGDFNTRELEFHAAIRETKSKVAALSPLTTDTVTALNCENNVVFNCQTSAGNLYIFSAINGEDGQEIELSKFTGTNTLVIKHNNNNGSGNQKFYTKTGSDITVTGYGCYRFRCYSGNWFQI